MRRFFINYGLYITIILGFCVAAGISLLLDTFQIALIPPERDWLIPAKLTFLSIILALGMFQYRYFYDESTEYEERAERGDFGPGWAEYVDVAKKRQQIFRQAEQQLTESKTILDRMTTTRPNESTSISSADYQRLQQLVNQQAQTLEQERRNLSLMNEAIKKANSEFRQAVSRVLLDFSIRLSLIFAVGFLVFTSLALDILSLVYTTTFAYPWSNSTFVASLLFLLILLILFLFIVQGQFRYFNERK